MTHQTMSWECFEERFQPLPNPLNENAALDGYMFETYGPELEHVQDQDGAHIWTYLSDDYDELLVGSGYHVVNRLGYLITRHPVPRGEEISVRFSDIWDTASDMIENYLLSDESDDVNYVIATCAQRGDMAAVVMQLLHTAYAGQYDPVRFSHQVISSALGDHHD